MIKTKLLPFLLISFSLNIVGQNNAIIACRNHFNNYLNFNGALSQLVSIDEDGIRIYASAVHKKNRKPDLVLYTGEFELFLRLTKCLPMDSLEKIMAKKGKEKWKNINPCSIAVPYRVGEPSDSLVLKGKRIMIDPGHIAGTMEMARIEQKFLHFTKQNYAELIADSIDIAEGILTYETAAILKRKLEDAGAIVDLSRTANSTSFGKSYEEWWSASKTRTLDSLFALGELSSERYRKLQKEDQAKFFWDFFRDYELAQRSRKINNWRPDVTLIIHYNVDEKNTDWLKPSDKNYTMTFIAGAMTADVFKNYKGKIHFLRLLIGKDLDLSEKLSALTVQEFHHQLAIPVATQRSATYLMENCMPASSPGVFCRNLALCRTIQSPLVYGECLFQDNREEYKRLCKKDKVYYGIQSNERVHQVANAYYKAIEAFYRKNKALKE